MDFNHGVHMGEQFINALNDLTPRKLVLELDSPSDQHLSGVSDSNGLMKAAQQLCLMRINLLFDTLVHAVMIRVTALNGPEKVMSFSFSRIQLSTEKLD